MLLILYQILFFLFLSVSFKSLTAFSLKKKSEAATPISIREKEPEDFEFLFQFQNPSDPAHVKKYNIMYNVAFPEFSNSAGPCRPILPFPKKLTRTFVSGTWRTPLVRLFSWEWCNVLFQLQAFQEWWKVQEQERLEVSGDKSVAKGKMKEHCRTAKHMLGIIRWKAFKRKAFDKALEKANFEMQAAKERERQNNREVI